MASILKVAAWMSVMALLLAPCLVSTDAPAEQSQPQIAFRGNAPAVTAFRLPVAQSMRTLTHGASATHLDALPVAAADLKPTYARERVPLNQATGTCLLNRACVAARAPPRSPSLA